MSGQYRKLQQKHKTYADYVAESKPITNHLMPVIARPKYSKGDNPGYRAKQAVMKSKGIVGVGRMELNKKGRVSKKNWNKLIRKELI